MGTREHALSYRYPRANEYKRGYRVGKLLGLNYTGNPYARGTPRYMRWNAGNKKGLKAREITTRVCNKSAETEINNGVTFWE